MKSALQYVNQMESAPTKAANACGRAKSVSMPAKNALPSVKNMQNNVTKKLALLPAMKLSNNAKPVLKLVSNALISVKRVIKIALAPANYA